MMNKLQLLRQKLAGKSILIVFLLFFVLLLIQYGTVFLAHDDYGHASLSYGYVEPNVAGSHFTPAQLFHYVFEMMKSSDPRVLMLFFDAILYSSGLGLTRVVATLLVCVVFFLVYRYARPQEGYKYPLAAAVLCISLFGFFPLESYRSGFYWFVALFGYITPIALLLLGLICYDKWESFSVPKTVLLGVLFFMVSFGQENIYALTFSVCLFQAVFQLVRIKKLLWKDITCLSASFLGIVLQFVSPGNSGRAQIIADEGLLNRAMTRYKELCSYLFGPQNTLFCFLLFAFCLLVGVQLWRRKKRAVSLLIGVPTLILLGITLIRLTGPFTVFKNPKVAIVVFTLYILLFVVAASVSLWEDKRMLAFFWGGVVSFAPCLLAPYIVTRMIIPFQFVLSILFLNGLSKLISTLPQKVGKPLFITAACLFALLAGINLGTTYRGYAANVPVQQHNDAELKIAHTRIAMGEAVPTVTLFTITGNTRFMQDAPWWETHAYIERYMKEYYDLPQDIVFEYQAGQGGAPPFTLESFFEKNAVR